MTDSIISEMMRSLEKFMQGITIHPLIKNSELVNLFLSMENKGKYRNQIKKYENRKPKTKAEQMITLDGLINVGIPNNDKIYLDNIKKFSCSHYCVLKDITEEYKSLIYIMSQLRNKMKDISKLFQKLLDKSIKYKDNKITSECFKIMSDFMNEWAKIQDNQIKILNENIIEYFDYVKNEFNSLSEMAINVSFYENNYKTEYNKLTKEKETLLKKPDIKSLELKEEDTPKLLDIMLPKHTMKVTELKKFYGCMINSLISEFKRIRNVNAKRHKENIINCLQELCTECNIMLICMADKISEIIDLNIIDNYNINIKGIEQLKKVGNLSDVPNLNINKINELNVENKNNFEKEIIKENEEDKKDN